jgi:hypothetical protein
MGSHGGAISGEGDALAVSEAARRPGRAVMEATPYYVSDRSACRAMASMLPVPGLKLVVMLRDPVERIFSEYQMKLRCVHMYPLTDIYVYISYVYHNTDASRPRRSSWR